VVNVVVVIVLVKHDDDRFGTQTIGKASLEQEQFLQCAVGINAKISDIGIRANSFCITSVKTFHFQRPNPM